VKVRALNARHVRELLSVEQCIPLMRTAMRLVARRETIQPIRQVMFQPDGRGSLAMMPGQAQAPRCLGSKAITVFPDNFGTALGSHQGLMLLFDPDNGAPVAVLDAREITAIRTAAATAVATDVLARKDVRSLAIFGYGEQAHTHADALTKVREFEEIVIWGRDKARAESFTEKLRAEYGARPDFPKRLRAVADGAVAAAADVVCTVTAAAEPFYRAEWLRPGQHINLVGAGIPSRAEAEPQVVPLTRYFADFKDSALALAGEFLRAKEAGLVNEQHVLGCVGDVLEGSVPGRKEPGDITLFKSIGMVVEDLVASEFVLREAERRETGQLVEW
jgi:ornithine cyclodeaminase/alanine dehydrogenase-like protein (mu-crystallin family)